MKQKFYTKNNKVPPHFISFKKIRLLLTVLTVIFSCNTLFAQIAPPYAMAENDISMAGRKQAGILQKQSASQTLKESSNDIWFEKNAGQFTDKNILYGFNTSFGSMGVFSNKLRLVTKQHDKDKNIGYQIVDITFPGSLNNWSVLPGQLSPVKGSYNTASATITPSIYNEITLQDVYPGVDLRLYAGENGALEFDWLVMKAADYNKIRMKFDGQDGIVVEKNGSLLIDLQHNDMKIIIPETYQLIHGGKKLLTARMKTLADNKTICYKISGEMDMEKPLVIDPVMIWSTYMHNNTKTFDEYLYTVAANANNEVYACGLTNEAMSSSYLSGVAPGFLGDYTFALNSSGKQNSVILYQLNATGTAIIAWTYTGLTTNIPVAMGIFPNNRILVVYQRDTVQIFSADLTTRHYNDVISASDVATKVASYQSLAIVDDDVFYLGGVANSALPSSIIPASAPDNVLAGNEGVILRIANATTSPTAEWGTYVGGSVNETFTAIALTTSKTKLAFAVHAESSGNAYPALVNEVDGTISSTELLVGAFTLPAPTTFDVFSYLGGNGNEGTTSAISAAALVAADDTYFYVAGNTSSTSLPGTTGAIQTTHGANSKLADQFVSRIPLNGSAGTGFVTTYNGGNDVDLVGGLVIDIRTNDVLLFGTSVSDDFPVFNSYNPSPYYQASHGSFDFGSRDITYTIFKNDLSFRIYSTYIGGAHDDYLGSTGKLQGTGHFQYNTSNGLTYIGTTIHSDQTTLPGPWMSDIPGFDKNIPAATTGKDSHYIFAINPNTSDFGDAPVGYDDADPAYSAVSLYDIKIGLTTDAEGKPNNSALADGDDLQNYGSPDDEDGVLTAPSMYPGATTYTVNVSVFNNTGASVQLYGWIDNDGNGVFDNYEFTSVTVPASNVQQDVVLNFTGLPPFIPISGLTYLRLRITDTTLTADNARGGFGKGEVEDYVVPQAVILPLTLVEFTASPQNENVQLKWELSQQTNISRYAVEHSTDNRVFTVIGTKPLNGVGKYNMLHGTPVDGENYYRIKMISSDGTFTYSPSRKVNFIRSLSVLVYPNPTRENINISFKGMANKAVTVSLITADGKVVTHQTIPLAGATAAIDVSRLAKRYYFVKIETDKGTGIKKVNITN
ncbi:MAG: T9SS type A sorting domain-containing protein [Chitinophagaceae bacterium]|nr:T9SS type A sorting domain-containing protein [Chitinophagaceae bacterium]